MKQDEDGLGAELSEVQREIEELETVYLESTGSKGNVLQGFGRYLIHRIMKYNKKPQKVQVHDYQRLFSLSSCSSRISKALGDNFERFSMHMHMHLQQEQSELHHHGKLLSSEDSKSDLFHSDSSVLSSSEQPSKRFQPRPTTPRRPKKPRNPNRHARNDRK